MRSTGSRGWIALEALAVIEERGLDPAETFREAFESSLTGGHGVSLDRDGRTEYLSCTDGVLGLSFSFDGGHYVAGCVSIWRSSFPASVLAAAVGKPLAAIMDHPAFRVSDAVVGRIVRDKAKREGDNAVLRFHHAVRLVTVEVAERRLASSPRSTVPAS